jgi:transposase
VYFVMDVVEQLDLRAFDARYEEADARGQRPFPPAMMVALLFYAYCEGVFSSRRIERATYEHVAFRVLAGGLHPHFTSIAAFRREHLPALQQLFLQVLQLCRAAGLVKLGHVALDGTKVQGDASKHKAMSYERMQQVEASLKVEVASLMAQAESEDKADDGRLGVDTPEVDVPAELARRETRLARIQAAKAALEAEARQARAAHLRELAEGAEERSTTAPRAKDRKRNATEAAQHRAKADKLSPPGDDDDPPFTTPSGLPKHRPKTTVEGEPHARAQHNFTDPDSRLMESGGAYLQGFNCQAAVDDAHQVIVAQDVSNLAPDNGYLAPMFEQVQRNLAAVPETLTADSGYWSPSALAAIEDSGCTPYIAVERRQRWREDDTITAGDASPDASPRERMAHRLRTPDGRAVYARRKGTVEPVFGQVKEARGFRRFLMRGLAKACGEWSLLCTTHNILKLFRAGAPA